MNERRRFLRVIAGSAVVAGFGCDGSAGTSSTTSGSTSGSSTSSGNGGAGGAPPTPCTMGPTGINVGPASGFTADGLHIVTNKGVLIGRDAGGLYALTALCPHSLCDMSAVDAQGPFGEICSNKVQFCTSAQAGDIICLCHGSVFDPSGAVVQGPAVKGLKALALTLGCDGSLYVDKSRTVASTVRLVV